MRRVDVAFCAACCLFSACDSTSNGETLYGALWEAFGEASEAPGDVVLVEDGWIRARSPEGLAALLSSSPGRGERPVVIYSYATWNAYGEPFERGTLLHPSVEEALAGYTRVLVDITEPTADEEALQRLLGYSVVVVFDRGDRVAAALGRGGTLVPRAKMKVDSADESKMRRRFLEMLK